MSDTSSCVGPMHAVHGANWKLRILIFGNSQFDLRGIAMGLVPSATVREVTWAGTSVQSLHGCPRTFQRIVETFQRCFILFKEIQTFHADVIIVQYAFHHGLIAGIAAKMSRKPCVVQAVGSDLKIEPLSKVGRLMVCLALRMSSGVICVSRDLEDIAKKLGARKTTVIPSPLDLSDFPSRNVLSKNSCRKRNEIIAVMKLSPVKGTSYLLKAMTYVKQANLIIIGDGPERTKMQSLSSSLGVNNRVSFLGWVDHTELWRNLQRASVFVLPSLSEGCPRVILEAMACGLPIVSTKVGGIPEVVEDGVNGILVPPMDEKALAEAIVKVMNDEIFRMNSSHSNREEAKKYASPIIGQRIYEYLTKIVARSTQGSQRNKLV